MGFFYFDLGVALNITIRRINKTYLLTFVLLPSGNN